MLVWDRGIPYVEMYFYLYNNNKTPKVPSVVAVGHKIGCNCSWTYMLGVSYPEPQPLNRAGLMAEFWFDIWAP